MKIGFDWNKNAVMLDISGENPAEMALLTHLQEGHVAILCVGAFGFNGVRVFIRNKSKIEFSPEIQDVLGRKKMLERRRNPKSKIRNKK